MTLQQSPYPSISIDFTSCRERPAPSPLNKVNQTYGTSASCVRSPAYFWKSGLDAWKRILTLSSGATTVFAYDNGTRRSVGFTPIRILQDLRHIQRPLLRARTE